jgi:hypothetical protein
VSSVSNSLYFLTLLLVSVMRVIYKSEGMSKKFGVHGYLLENAVIIYLIYYDFKLILLPVNTSNYRLFFQFSVSVYREYVATNTY